MLKKLHDILFPTSCTLTHYSHKFDRLLSQWFQWQFFKVYIQSRGISSLIALIYKGYTYMFHIVLYRVVLSVTKIAIRSEKASFNEGGTGRWSQLDSAVKKSATQSTKNVRIMLTSCGKSTHYSQIILDAFIYLLWSKWCDHISPKPSFYWFSSLLFMLHYWLQQPSSWLESKLFVYMYMVARDVVL